jgi:S-layer protein
LPSTGTVTFKADGTNGKAATVNLTDATGSADVLNVVLSKATALANVELTAAGVETVNVTSTETATTLLGTVTHAATLTINDAKSLNISGNAGVTLSTLTGATALTSIDASGVTAGLVSFTTAALAAASTIKGGADANTIVASAATKAVTYTGGAKVDTITINNALNNVVSTLAGNDVIVTGSGADTIYAGDGNDTITSGAGLDVIDVGAGNDTFVVTGNANGNVYASITGMSKGDKIDFMAGAGIATFTTAKITLSSTAAFADFLSAAAAGGADRVVWFQYAGDTYLVHDLTAGSTFTNGATADQVVKLVGLVDLSTATIDGAVTNILTLG